MQTLKRKRIPLWLGVVIAVAVLSGLILLIGWGNDYTSCKRSNSVRETANARALNAAQFWDQRQSSLAAVASEASARATRLEATVDEPAVDEMTAWLRVVAEDARATAGEYATFAAEQESLLYPLLDCSVIPPQTR